MDELFGDATAAMPTPVTHGERDSLMGVNSPVPSLDLHRHGNFTADSAIPGLNIDPPVIGQENNGKPGNSDQNGESQGLSGWISNMLRRSNQDSSKRSQYRRVDQDEES